jgi:hypothetical protein
MTRNLCRWRRLRAAAGFLLPAWTAVLACCRPAVPDDTGGARLELEEHRSYDFPRDEPVLGIAASGGAPWVAWSRGAVAVFAAADQEPATFSTLPLGDLDAVALVSGDTLLEAVDARAPRLLRFDRRGHVRTERPLALPGTVRASVRHGDRWVIGVADSLEYRVYAVSWGAPPPVLLHRRARSTSAGEGDYQIAAAGGGVLLTDLGPPFATRRIGAPADSFAPGPAARELLRAERSARWISLPVVDLGTGYLQTLADLAGDGRVFVSYDRTGRPRSVRRVDAPVGVVGITPDRRLLVGSRGGRPSQIVLYRWRWTTDPSQGESR